MTGLSAEDDILEIGEELSDDEGGVSDELSNRIRSENELSDSNDDSYA